MEIGVNVSATEPDTLLYKVPVVCVKLRSFQERVTWSSVLHNTCAIFSTTEGEQSKVSVGIGIQYCINEYFSMTYIVLILDVVI